MALTLAAASCAPPSDGEQVEEQKSALGSSGFQWMIVPAYYSSDSTGDSSWSQLDSGGATDSFSPLLYAIVNAGCEAINTTGGNWDVACSDTTGGPYVSGRGVDDALKSRITTMYNYGIDAIGYVDLGAGRNGNDVAYDVARWRYYGVTGIFFDRVGNTRPSNPTDAQKDTYAANGRWASDTAAEYGFSQVIFNFGYTGQWMERFVNCLATYRANTLFVTEETDYATYGTISASAVMTDPNYQWLASYNPGHFIHLVHTYTGTTSAVNDVLGKAAGLNAGLVYVTDQPKPAGGNPWDPIAGYPVWSAEWNDTYGQFYGSRVSFPGSTDAAAANTCPPESPVGL